MFVNFVQITICDFYNVLKIYFTRRSRSSSMLYVVRIKSNYFLSEWVKIKQQSALLYKVKNVLVFDIRPG